VPAAVIGERSPLEQARVREPRGSSVALYVLVCALCALFTAAVSLDGAVVLMIPLLVILARRFDAPFGALFLGAVVVANAASIAVPEGNPTNLVIINRLGISAAAFLAHMLAPGIAAAAICAAGVAIGERRALSAPLRTATRQRTPLSSAERHAALSLTLAALVAWAAPIVGIAPWWPFSAAVALALASGRERPRLIIPWRIALQVGGLLIVTQALGLTRPPIRGRRPARPARDRSSDRRGLRAGQQPPRQRLRDWAADGRRGRLCSLGRARDRLARHPPGISRPLIATQLAGPTAPALRVRRFAPLAAASALAATLLLWANI